MGNNARLLFVLRINMSGFYRMAVVGTILTRSLLRYVSISIVSARTFYLTAKVAPEKTSFGGKLFRKGANK